MKSEIQINNTAGVCQIDIEGTIGVPEEWQFEEPDARVATYERFRDTLRRIAEIEAPEVVVNIRSTGGDVNDALLIHDALRQLPARVTTRCYGYTASAATIIAQAASEGCRLLSANALYLIHTAICSTEGNAAEIAGKIDLLHQTDARIAAVYASRSGRPAAEFEALMAENNGSGRWLDVAGQYVTKREVEAIHDAVDRGELTTPEEVDNRFRVFFVHYDDYAHSWAEGIYASLLGRVPTAAEIGDAIEAGRNAREAMRRTTDADRERDCSLDMAVSYGLDSDDAREVRDDYYSVRGLK